MTDAAAEPRAGRHAGDDPAAGGMLSRLGGLVLRYRWAVAGFWLAALVAGAVLAPAVTHRMSSSFTFPGEPGYQANAAISAVYRGGTEPPLVPVVTLPPGGSAHASQAQLARAFAAAGRTLGAPVAWYGNTGDPHLLAGGGRIAFGWVFPPGAQWLDLPDYSARVTAAMRPLLPPGAALRVTGIAALTRSAAGGGGRSTGIVEVTLAGAVLALAVLAFVFGSLLALAPLLIAAVAIFATFLALGAVELFAGVNTFIEYIVALLGLGVAIDYSLLIATRWREELHRGHAGDEAVRRAVATAGRAVLASGLTVAAGLLSLTVLPVPFIASIGYSGMFIPLISALAAVTLLPVILAAAGRRLDWPHLRTETSASRGWAAWARGVIRWRWPAIAAGAGVLAALAVFALSMSTGNPAVASLARSGPAYQGVAALRSAGVPAGALSPVEILVPRGADPAAAARRLATTGGVWDALAPDDLGWRRNGTALALVLPAADPATSQGQATLTRVRQAAAREIPGSQAGGTAAQDADFSHAVYGRVPLMLAVLGLITLVLLTRAFRSIALAVKAVAVSLASIAAVLGAVVLIWQRGYGSSAVWGIPATGAVLGFLPVLVFAFLFGLSTDYEVFLISRIREEHDRGGSTARAVAEGTGRTGRLITSAALILFFAFAALSAGAPQTPNKMFASALGIGILLDATVVRALLVPALVAGLGGAAWWLPRCAARALRIRDAAAPPRPPGHG